ncbi:hypothetical protein [Streptomyces sp. NPDC004050]
MLHLAATGPLVLDGDAGRALGDAVLLLSGAAAVESAPGHLVLEAPLERRRDGRDEPGRGGGRW